MKWLCIILIGTFLTTQNNWLLSRKSVGSLKVGCDVTEVYDLFDKEKQTSIVDRYTEATFTPAIEVTMDNELLFVGEINCSTIRSFEIFSNKYRTASGVSVGSTLAHVKSKYSLIVESREGNLAVVAKESDMVFNLEQTKKIQSINVLKGVSLKELPDDVKVTSIVVY